MLLGTERTPTENQRNNSRERQKTDKPLTFLMTANKRSCRWSHFFMRMKRSGPVSVNNIKMYNASPRALFKMPISITLF